MKIHSRTLRYGAFYLLVVGQLLAACSTGPQRVAYDREVSDDVVDGDTSPPAIPWKTASPDKIAPGFELRATSSADPKINGTYRIDAQGVLGMPYDVKVKTTGLTLPQLQAKVNSSYKEFLTTPDVKLEVTEKQYWVNIQGLVMKPGAYLIDGESSLDDLIAKAEGLKASTNERDNAQYARIEQAGVKNLVKLRDYYSGKRELLPKWQGGEKIVLQSERGGIASGQERQYIEVLGEVKVPGEYPVQPGADFYDYLIKARGPTENADLHNIYLLQTVGKRREKFTFSMEDAHKLPPLKAGDALIVNSDVATPAEKQSRTIGNFTGIFVGIATTALLALGL